MNQSRPSIHPENLKSYNRVVECLIHWGPVFTSSLCGSRQIHIEQYGCFRMLDINISSEGLLSAFTELLTQDISSLIKKNTKKLTVAECHQLVEHSAVCIVLKARLILCCVS